MISLTETSTTIILVFAIAALGYLLGRVRIKGIGLGTAAIFLVGLIFGHFGAELPEILQTVGLVLFITSVGFSAGPGFLQRLRKSGVAYVVLCVITAAVGGCLCLAVIHFGKVDAPLAVGIMTGAFTTSPGFAAAKEAVAASSASIVAAGYGIVYPVGVICKVLFIQLIPKLLHADMDKERALIAQHITDSEKTSRKLLTVDKYGIFPFTIAVLIGIAVGSIHIPLPGGSSFALGVTGGPLLVSLLLSAMGRIGALDIRCSNTFTNPVKELGLLLFYSGAGVQGGHGIAEIFQTYGVLPILYGVLFVAVPLCSGFLVFRYLLKLPLLNGLGAMTASMTCTPSLAVLTQMAETDDVVAAYATTYPVALITLVLLVQFLLT